MSHLHERKEKICLNCNAELIDRYCHHCGQENVEPKETVWHLVQHFFNDITHFDGKFFASVKYLLRRPGFLSKEYMVGRRASYLNPIRMYVFSSAIFFLLLFSLKKHEEIPTGEEDEGVKKESVEAVKKEKGRTVAELRELRTKLADRLDREADDDDRQDYKSRVAKLDLELAAIKKYYGDTTTRSFDNVDLGLLLAKAVKDSVVLNIQEEGKRAVESATGKAATAAREGRQELMKRTGDTGTYRYKGPSAARLDSEDRARAKEPKKDLAERVGDKLANSKAIDKLGEKIEKKSRKDTTVKGKPVQIMKDGKMTDEDADFDFLGMDIGHYRNVAQYDSAQKALPEKDRDGWITRQATRKAIIAFHQMRADKERWTEYFIENLMHSIPKILFISLPIFAMILNILYFRQKKTYYYVSHGIFAIQVYCAIFILGIGIILFNKLSELTDMRWVHVICSVAIFGIVLYMMIYLYKAMRGFYGQGRAKTLLKYLIACWIGVIVNTILFVLFVLISAITI